MVRICEKNGLPFLSGQVNYSVPLCHPTTVQEISCISILINGTNHFAVLVYRFRYGIGELAPPAFSISSALLGVCIFSLSIVSSSVAGGVNNSFNSAAISSGVIEAVVIALRSGYDRAVLNNLLFRRLCHIGRMVLLTVST